MIRLQFSMELRNQNIDVDLQILPPEPSVGIMGYGFEDEIIRDSDGAVLPWELTDDEIEKICETVDDIARSWEP